MKLIAITFAVLIVIITALITWHAWPPEDPLAIGSFAISTLTLLVLTLYAYDTNSMARVTRERWLRDGVLSTTYEMALVRGDKNGRTLFRLHNPSTLVVRATVNCNFKIYGEPTTAGRALDGTEVWVLFPQQVSQGWFEIDSLLQTKGKNVAAMLAERSTTNSSIQLTMMLELEFWDELGARRQLPKRTHNFDFDEWAWIPSLTEQL